MEYVYDGLMRLGAQIAKDTVDMVREHDGHVPSIPQGESENLNNAPKIFRETCEIDWAKPAKQVYDFVRGLSPVPGAWSMVRLSESGDPQMMKIYKTAKTGEACDAVPGDSKDHLRCAATAGALPMLCMATISNVSITKTLIDGSA